MEGGELVRARAEQDRAGGAANEALGESGAVFHLPAHGEVGQQGADRSVGLARQAAAGPILDGREPRRFGIGGDVGQRIDGHPARQRVGGMVHVY